MFSYIKHVLAILVISKTLLHYLQFTTLLQITFVSSFCVSSLAFNWKIETLYVTLMLEQFHDDLVFGQLRFWRIQP